MFCGDASKVTNIEKKNTSAEHRASSGQHPRAHNASFDTASDPDWRTFAIRTAATLFEEKFVDLLTGLGLSKTAARSILNCVKNCCRSVESKGLQSILEDTGRTLTRKVLQVLAEAVETGLEACPSFKRLAQAARDGVVDAVCSAMTYVKNIITKIYK